MNASYCFYYCFEMYKEDLHMDYIKRLDTGLLAQNLLEVLSYSGCPSKFDHINPTQQDAFPCCTGYADNQQQWIARPSSARVVRALYRSLCVLMC